MNNTVSIQEWLELKSMVIDNNTMLKKLTEATEKELLTPKEVRELLKISPRTYHRYVKTKLFTQIQLDEGKRVYVKRSEINRLIEEGKV